MHFKGRIEQAQFWHPALIVPVLNIAFILFVFSILASGFVIEPGVRVNLPQSVTSRAITTGDTEVFITQQDTVYLQGKLCGSAQLKALFSQAASAGRALLIKADKRASLGGIARVWDLARELGIARVNIITNQ